MENRMTMLESRECSFAYPTMEENVLEDISFSVKAGECVLFCGCSGCGKSTLLRLMNGLSPGFFKGKMSGSFETIGMKAGEVPIEEYVPLVGSVFQNPKTQNFNVNTTSELAFPCENTGMDTERMRKRVKECAKELKIEGLLNRSIFCLSGGEKQRVACASACMLEPELLVLDEPTSNLDEKAIEDLRQFIARKKAQGVTVVIAEHRLEWLKQLVDRCFYFEQGKLSKVWSREEFHQLTIGQLYEMGLRAIDLKGHKEKIERKQIEAGEQTEIAVSVSELKIGYKKQKEVCTISSFDVCHGEIVGLMGQNGVGKSTLAKTLCGLVKPLSGKIYWRGKKASGKEMIKHSFMVMQDVNYQLFCESVKEEVILGSRGEQDYKVILEKLDLLELEERHPMSLSGGQKQRVAVASAIMSGKEFIVFDEPTSGLDHLHMEQVGEMLELLKEQGKAVLVITHDEELAADWCDRVVKLYL
ncbi:MAG: ABC transporter ATP-binding protein [Lachnospiraceae bacterium]|nr:ABC transporter ATP-binding protein [Lachnospiraceae bacterium]